jgi:hypothetical protein
LHTYGKKCELISTLVGQHQSVLLSKCVAYQQKLDQVSHVQGLDPKQEDGMEMKVQGHEQIDN